jgi:hypothetical protein
MSDQLLPRTKALAPRVVKLVDSLPRRMSTDVIGRQIPGSAASVGANDRSARWARSNEIVVMIVASIRTARRRKAGKAK